MLNKVIVLLPVYKTIPSEEEKRSMVQTLKILGNHPIRIIGPENIDYREYKEMGFTDDQIMRMHADHFKGIAAYNKMLCAKWFYRTFEDFEYIFIMQNDAWVFRDELDIWCSKGYDYIGSPWIWEAGANEGEGIDRTFSYHERRNREWWSESAKDDDIYQIK